MTNEEIKFLENLVLTEWDYLILYTYRLVHDLHVAEDLVQDTFHDAVKAVSVLSEHPVPRAWLLVVLRRKIQRYWTETNEVQKIVAPESEAISMANPVDCIRQVEARIMLEEIRDQLSDNEWELVQRILISKEGHEQVAHELGISKWACQKRLERIRRRLHKKYPKILELL